MNMRIHRIGVAALLWLLVAGVQAQVPQYGGNVNLEQARKAIAAAEAEARKNS
jgi:hypothetical protein